MLGISRLFTAILAGMFVFAAAPADAQIYSEQHLFLQAVREKNGDTVIETLAAPGNTLINSRDVSTGETALHIVVGRRDATWVRFLAGKGANPNIADKSGTYPIQLAAQLGFAEGVEALLSARARVDVANDTGETPLIAAVHRRDFGLMRILLENGADVDRNDNSGRSARDYATLQGPTGGTLAVIRENEEERGPDRVQIYGPSFN